MHAVSSYRGNRLRKTHKQTDRGDYNTLRRSFPSAQCNDAVTSRTASTAGHWTGVECTDEVRTHCHYSAVLVKWPCMHAG